MPAPFFQVLAQFERRLVRPSRGLLVDTLKQATANVIRPEKAPVVAAVDWISEVEKMGEKSEGIALWEEKFTCRHAFVAVAWWTDHSDQGRRHFRVHAAHVEDGRRMVPFRSEHPVACVYPENVVWRGFGEAAPQELPLCGCGEYRPATNPIGWMGPCCAVCHERENGDPTTGGAGNRADSCQYCDAAPYLDSSCTRRPGRYPSHPLHGFATRCCHGH